MRLTLFIVPNSHPCRAVAKAMELKGIEPRVIEWPPPLHAPIQKALFGKRTVPAIRIKNNGTTERVSGSRSIMGRLDELVPEPPLYPSDPGLRARVQAAEQWGDEVLQPLGRTLTWAAMIHSPDAMVSYSEGSKLPLPDAVIRRSAPLIARASAKLNRTGDEAARRDMAALPGYLDKVDELIAAGTIGAEGSPNAADLQIASTLRLLMTLEDVRPLIESRPAGQLAVRLFPQQTGTMPAGSLPAGSDS